MSARSNTVTPECYNAVPAGVESSIRVLRTLITRINERLLNLLAVIVNVSKLRLCTESYCSCRLQKSKFMRYILNLVMLRLYKIRILANENSNEYQ